MADASLIPGLFPPLRFLPRGRPQPRVLLPSPRHRLSNRRGGSGERAVVSAERPSDLQDGAVLLDPAEDTEVYVMCGDFRWVRSLITRVWSYEEGRCVPQLSL